MCHLLGWFLGAEIQRSLFFKCASQLCFWSCQILNLGDGGIESTAAASLLSALPSGHRHL